MEKNQIKLNDSKGLIVVGCLAVLFIAGIMTWTYVTFINIDSQERGTFGDMFGAANALFSGLAFVGIIITVLLQKQELSLQRQEIIETRKELKRSATAQERSQRALVRQAENLKISAKLAALNSLVTHYSELETRIRRGYQSTIDPEEAVLRRDRYVLRIEELLERKERR